MLVIASHQQVHVYLSRPKLCLGLKTSECSCRFFAMSADVAEDAAAPAAVVFRCLRAGIAPICMDTAVKSAHALHLIPTTSDFCKAPSRGDIEEHFKLLCCFMEAFPQKAPCLSSLVDGICALDDFYRKALSKCKTKRGQEAWAAVDGHSIKLFV